MSQHSEPAAYLGDTTTGPLTAAAALQRYAGGMVPVAGTRQRTTDWVIYVPAAMVAVRQAHLPRSLRKTLRRGDFTLTSDTAFDQVLAGCSAPRPNGGLITADMQATALALHGAGHAHAIECWDASGLAGGLYGLTIGGLFIGESMFWRRPDAGKAAFAGLLAYLVAGGFTEIDAQMPSDNLARYGAKPLETDTYQLRRAAAMTVAARWPGPTDAAAALERLIAPAG